MIPILPLLAVSAAAILLSACKSREDSETEAQLREVSIDQAASPGTEPHRLMTSADLWTKAPNQRSSIRELEGYWGEPKHRSLFSPGALDQAKGLIGGRIAAGAYVPQLPASFYLDEELVSATMSFHVQDDRKRYGRISAPWFRLTPAFQYCDASGKEVAKGQVELISVGTTISVTDPSGKRIGKIKEEIFQNFGFTNRYTILDAQDREVATSDKLELLSTSFTIKDKAGQVVAEIYQPALHCCTERWAVEVQDSSKVDSRLLALLPPFKTLKDAERRREQEETEQEERKNNAEREKQETKPAGKR
ncbi:MAG TPA: hypothetical protein VJR29_14135 [bacterium]|nr:hypothetical protein [bacterium]